MRLMKITDTFSIKMNDKSEHYDVVVHNDTHKVLEFESEFSEISEMDIQNLVDKMFRHEMITPMKGEEVTEVSIMIWDIDETGELHIETYHIFPDIFNGIMCDEFDRTMSYDEFLELE